MSEIIITDSARDQIKILIANEGLKGVVLFHYDGFGKKNKTKFVEHLK